MTHADRAYTAPQELYDIRKEFKPYVAECEVDGVVYVAAPIEGTTDGEGDYPLCKGCAGDGKPEVCSMLEVCTTVSSSIIWKVRP